MPDIGGIPYVESSDLVSGWPTVSQSVAQEVSDQLASKADYPSGGSNGDLLTKSGTTTAWAAPSVAGITLITSDTFSAVSSVSVNSCFSATYDNYRIILSNVTGSLAVNDWRIRMRASGSDQTSSIYTLNLIYNTEASGPNRSWNGAYDSGYLGYIMDEGTMAAFDICSPFDTARTQGSGVWSGFSTSATTLSGWFGFTLDDATSYDGFTMLVNAGTMSGTLRVYGYKD